MPLNTITFNIPNALSIYNLHIDQYKPPSISGEGYYRSQIAEIPPVDSDYMTPQPNIPSHFDHENS